MRALLHAYRYDVPEVDPNDLRGFDLDDLSPGNYQPHLRKPTSELTTTELLLVRPAVLLELCHLAQNRRVFLKTHNAFAVIDDIPLIPPVLTEGAVYMVRDPRDVVLSYAAHSGRSTEEMIAVLNKDTSFAGNDRGTWHALFTWSMHVTSWLDNPTFPRHCVRYEDLLARPEEVLEGVVNHLGWDLDTDRVCRAVQATTFDKLQQHEAQNGFREKHQRSTDQFFREGKAGGWKGRLTRAEAQSIEDQHGEVMGRLGYL